MIPTRLSLADSIGGRASGPAGIGGGARAGQLRFGDAHLVRDLRDLGEVPVGDLLALRAKRPSPVAEELAHYADRRVRHGAGVRHPLERGAVLGGGTAAGGVGPPM